MEKPVNFHTDVDYQNEIFHMAAWQNSNYITGEKTKMKCQSQNPTYRLVKKATTNPPNKTKQKKTTKKNSATEEHRESEDREE